MDEQSLYEIHITVINVTPAEFKQACHELGIKPIVLQLQSKSAGLIPDAMTSSKYSGSFVGAQAQSVEIAQALNDRGIETIRTKIETVPWNPLVLRSVGKPGTYFESHLALKINRDVLSEKLSILKELCADFDLHLSRNVFKEFDDHIIQMATLREAVTTHEAFATRAKGIVDKINSVGIEVGKLELEFALLDTNEAHDGKWIL